MRLRLQLPVIAWSVISAIAALAGVKALGDSDVYAAGASVVALYVTAYLLSVRAS